MVDNAVESPNCQSTVGFSVSPYTVLVKSTATNSAVHFLRGSPKSLRSLGFNTRSGKSLTVTDPYGRKRVYRHVSVYWIHNCQVSVPSWGFLEQQDFLGGVDKVRENNNMPRDVEGGGEREGDSTVPRLSPNSSTRLRGRPDPFLVVCKCFSILTSLTAILCIAVNVLSAVRSFKNESDIFDGIFRCYAVLIAAFVALAETEWEFVVRFWKVLEYWAGRGMLQIFVAVMTRAFPDYSRDQKDLILLQNIASYLLLACGVVYVFSGILCIGFLKRARQKKEVTREQAVKDLEDLERRREELEQLLIAERA
ncbi:hypothetical protein FNV43_RR22180 [Rhamnella rubrinervis]|uniref:Uncharacterized protein n=1 Tax=Rhamnella rubrinervis TaxID=2594499 RepID=A0A8K0DVP3_9ROSA|nr:hypothetical protein FNV43_RR22180 [Rhamnella rubrinervis]